MSTIIYINHWAPMMSNLNHYHEPITMNHEPSSVSRISHRESGHDSKHLAFHDQKVSQFKDLTLGFPSQQSSDDNQVLSMISSSPLHQLIHQLLNKPSRSSLFTSQWTTINRSETSLTSWLTLLKHRGFFLRLEVEPAGSLVENWSLGFSPAGFAARHTTILTTEEDWPTGCGW